MVKRYSEVMNAEFYTIEKAVTELVGEGVKAYLRQTGADLEPPPARLEQPRNPDHGDWACSLAMRLAKPLRSNPMGIAEGIVESLPQSDLIERPEVARPGFINLRMGPGAVGCLVRHVLAQGERYGHGSRFAGRRALVEFVSANPTGPLHIGHCRGAVVGDALARIHAAAGYEVTREYYYNDAGVQMRLLGESLRARYRQALGEPAQVPENGYQGRYMVELGEQLKSERGEALRAETDSQVFTHYAAEHILKLIEADMESLRIHFDHWFSETTLHGDGAVDRALVQLEGDGKIYESDGAKWLRTEDFGDEKDRVVIKSDGEYTYLAPDIAYHQYKFERGYDRLVNVLGADHHGYVPRLKAAVQALGHEADQLDCILVQMVGLKRGGEAIKLSTRAGDFITLKEVIDEIGPDVTRFLFLLRSPDSQMVFDFDLAKDTSMENPVYYVQYAHARCRSLMRKAEEADQAWRGGADADLGLLDSPEEKAIARQMDRLPGVVEEIAEQSDPMLMTAYLRDLATAFHAYFTAGNRDRSLRVIRPENPALTEARLTLIAALRQTLANGLGLLGVTPLDRL